MSSWPSVASARCCQFVTLDAFRDSGESSNTGWNWTTAALSLGYFHSLPVQRRLALDLGGLVSKYDLPSALTPAYGGDPTSFMLFARVRLC